MKPRSPATRDHHPAKRSQPPLPAGAGGTGGSPPANVSVGRDRRSRLAKRAADRGEGLQLRLPRDTNDVEVRFGSKTVRLTNLEKLFWPDLGLTKRDLLQYYADVSPWLLPHIKDRAMVM